MKYLSLLLLLIPLLLNCKPSTTRESPMEENAPIREVVKKEPLALTTVQDTFDRRASLDRLKAKIANGKPLVIHAMIPLCDNENQGIVPVSRSLGDGLNPKTNLYWGALYGVANYFKKISKWKVLAAYQNVDESIIERIIFYQEYPNSAKVYLVADAYRGAAMEACLLSFFNAVAGQRNTEIDTPDGKIGIDGYSDLIIFNGHNGLMDHEMEYVFNEDGRQKEVSVIGCISHEYFAEHLKASQGYPLLMTTNLMAPEAYVMNALVDSWVNLKDGSEIRTEVGKAYHQYQKCGIRGATRLFRTGW